MLNNYFRKSVVALSSTLVDLYADTPMVSDKEKAEVTNFVFAAHARMADYLRFPFLLLTIFFCASSRPWSGRMFWTQNPTERLQTLKRWKAKGGQMRNDWLRFFESVVIVALLDAHRPEIPHASR